MLDGIDVSDRVVVNPPDALEPGEQVNLSAQDATGTANTPSKP